MNVCFFAAKQALKMYWMCAFSAAQKSDQKGAHKELNACLFLSTDEP